MNQDKKWLLEDMTIDRFNWYITDLQNWRENKCNQLLKTISDMMQAEPHRRIMGERLSPPIT